MTYALLAALVLVVGLFLHHIRETKKTTDLQVSGLLNRIQAPERAVQQSISESTPTSTDPLHLNPDDDAAYWKAQERYT